MKIAAIHQPNHLPWLGYWLKMACADLFIFNNNCPLNERGFSRRVAIAGSLESPIYSRLKLLQPYKSLPLDEVRVDFSKAERNRLFSELENTLGSFRHFAEFADMLQTTWETQEESPTLSKLNEATVRAFAKTLLPEMEQMPRASMLAEYQSGPSMLARLLDATGAELYLAGAGAGGYLKEEDLKDFFMPVVVQDFSAYAKTIFAREHLSFAAAASHLGMVELSQQLQKVAREIRSRIMTEVQSQILANQDRSSFLIQMPV